MRRSLANFSKTLVYKRAPRHELFARGHRACQGCAPALGIRYILKAAGPNTIVVSATGCMEIVSSPFPYTAWGVPWIHVAFENAAAVASGVEAAIRALKRKGRLNPEKRVNVIALAGDGGTADIGLQALSGMLARNHNVLYICYDNEAYMNTGVQGSSATPYGAHTTTTPVGRVSMGQGYWKKNLAAIAAAHEIPYVATACPSYPLDLMEKVKKALSCGGASYIHMFAVCPTGWGCPSSQAIKIGRLAVETGIFPLYEVYHGKIYRISYEPPKGLRPVEEYLRTQKRFRHLGREAVERIQKRVCEHWNWLKMLEEMTSTEEFEERLVELCAEA